MSATDAYTGVDNLEVMDAAGRYRRYLLGLVADVAGPPDDALHLLDFGAGTATHAVALHDLGYDVACTEIDIALRSRLLDLGFDARPSATDFGTKVFDVVYSMNVLEHIDDDLGALRTLFDVARPGGKLVLYVPAFPMLYSTMDRKVGHVRRYRRRNLVDLVTAAGFRVDTCAYVDILGFPVTLLYKGIGSRRGDISTRSVGAYDRFVFPISRVVDRVTGRFAGKNLALIGHRG